MTATTLIKTAEQIYRAWDDALAANDVEGLLVLYTEEAMIESPLIPHLLAKEQGIVKGKPEIKMFIEILAKRKPVMRQFFKQNFFTDGHTLIFEYPRQTPQGEQMDFMEVMEIESGFIHYHRVYWGWRGFKVLQENKYYRS